MLIFDLVNRHADWIAFRQSIAAKNIANADTPGFTAKAVGDFAAGSARYSLEPLRTDQRHLAVGGGADSSFSISERKADDPTLSGNTVNLNEELMIVGENMRMRSFDTSVARSFHRMLLSSLKV